MSYHYGFSFGQISETPLAAVEAYLVRLPKYAAQGKLDLAQAVSMPYMTDDNRRVMLGEWERIANDGMQTAKKATKADLIMLGIGVSN
ncbi:MAG: hypothetical protein HN413_08040 [Chloroflexi bacterium]|nr:hypothetical protein [Chloroflexota bacterium]